MATHSVDGPAEPDGKEMGNSASKMEELSSAPASSYPSFLLPSLPSTTDHLSSQHRFYTHSHPMGFLLFSPNGFFSLCIRRRTNRSDGGHNNALLSVPRTGSANSKFCDHSHVTLTLSLNFFLSTDTCVHKV